MKLPANPTVDDYQKFYDSLPESQKQQFIKAGLKKLIESVYVSGIDDVIQDPTPAPGTTSSGYFLDDGKKFRYEIQGNNIAYNPAQEYASTTRKFN